MKISIVIPTLGNLKNLYRLLDSLFKQRTETDPVEILVVVNGMDKQESIAELKGLLIVKYEFLKLFFITEKGVNFARNLGLAKSLGEVILFLDDDCQLPDVFFLKHHIDFHIKNPGVFAVGGGYCLPDSVEIFDRIYNEIQMRWFFSGISGDADAGSTQYLLGGNFSIKSSVAKFQNLNFDEQITYGGSEFEFFKKAVSLNLVLVATEFEVMHHTHESLSGLTIKLFKQGRGKAHIDRKYPVSHSKASTALNTIQSSSINRFLRYYFNYVFWLGYYQFQNNFKGFCLHVVKDFFNGLNSLRFQTVSKITEQIRSKKEKGDRF